MKSLEILIIENEFRFIEVPFKFVNEVYFNNDLNYTVIEKSQDLPSQNNLKTYEMIFLDISLAKISTLDGFGILQKLKNESFSFKNLIIITGNHNIQEKLDELNLGSFPILTKPLDFNDLLKVIKPIYDAK